MATVSDKGLMGRCSARETATANHYANRISGDMFIFQQDNAQAHRAQGYDGWSSFNERHLYSSAQTSSHRTVRSSIE